MDIFTWIKEVFFFSGYLSNHSRTFPKPLSSVEEKEYITRYIEGDERAKDKLIEHNLRLVVHIAKKYSNANDELDDFISIGTIGLIKGINTFQPEKGSLVTYIARCIENEILMYLRNRRHSNSEISLGEAIGEDKEGNKISLFDILSTDENDVADKVEIMIQTEKLESIIDAVLNSREKVVIELRYGLRDKNIMPQREIAKILGISRSYVSRIEKKALAKLNKALDKV